MFNLEELSLEFVEISELKPLRTYLDQLCTEQM